jgi:uncharacterized protein with PQ loop repeat
MLMNLGLDHLHARRQYKNLSTYPHPNKLIRFFDGFMYAVGVIAPLALLPQVIQLYFYRNAAGLSPLTWALLGIINGCWATYGALHRQSPILVANLGMATLDFVILIGIFLFH